MGPRARKKMQRDRIIMNNPKVINKSKFIDNFGIINRKNPWQKQSHLKRRNINNNQRKNGNNHNHNRTNTTNNKNNNYQLTKSRKKPNVWGNKHFDADKQEMKNIGDIFVYKMPFKDRDQPCIQNGWLSLSGCRADMRRASKPGSVICGVSCNDDANYVNNKIEFMTIVDKKMNSTVYFNGSLNVISAKNNPFYRKRRDCKYMLADGDKQTIKIIPGENERGGMLEFIYWISRIPKNVFGDKEVIMSRKFITFFNDAGPPLSKALVQRLKQKRRSFTIESEFRPELLAIMVNYAGKRRINGANKWLLSSTARIPRMLGSDNELMMIWTSTISLHDIYEYLDGMDIPDNAARKNAKRKGVKTVKSMSLGKLTHFGQGYLSTKTIKHSKLFIMASKWGAQRGLKYGGDFTAICFNKNFQCAPHIDQYNVGMNKIIGFGPYVKGELRVGNDVIDIHNKLVEFDPKTEHEVLPFSGTRYSMTFFTSMSSN